MSTSTTPPQFRTICRIGHWLHLDAMWNTDQEKFGLTSNYVCFHLVDGGGDTMPIGFRIITTKAGDAWDEDGRQFPDLETAIRHHAKDLLKIEWQWTYWRDSPPEHRSKLGDVTMAAFSPRDIAWAMQMAAEQPPA